MVFIFNFTFILKIYTPMSLILYNCPFLVLILWKTLVMMKTCQKMLMSWQRNVLCWTKSLKSQLQNSSHYGMSVIVIMMTDMDDNNHPILHSTTHNDKWLKSYLVVDIVYWDIHIQAMSGIWQSQERTFWGHPWNVCVRLTNATQISWHRITMNPYKQPWWIMVV